MPIDIPPTVIAPETASVSLVQQFMSEIAPEQQQRLIARVLAALSDRV